MLLRLSLHDWGMLRRLELGDDPGEALGQGVVDLAGQSLAFVLRPGLAGLGDQLRVEPGVLVQRRLKSLDEAPACVPRACCAP